MQSFRCAHHASKKIAPPGQSANWPPGSFIHGSEIKTQQPQIIPIDDESTQPHELSDEQMANNSKSEEEDFSDDSEDAEAAFREHCKEMFKSFGHQAVSQFFEIEKKKHMAKKQAQKPKKIQKTK